MKNIHITTTIGLALLLASVGFLFTSIPYVSSALALLAFFCALSETAKYTGYYQFAVVFFSAAALGVSLEFPFHEKKFLIVISLLLAASVNIVRLIFFTQFGYSRFRYFEMACALAALAFYVAENIFEPSADGWSKWAFPAPVILFSIYIGYGVIQDSKGLLAYLKHRKYVEPGNPAPEFALPDQDGNLTSLSDFRGKRDLLLIFVRGDWCPGCHMMLRTYQRESHRFKEKNILCMAIGPDPVGVNRAMVEKLGLDFKVLSDDKQKIAQTYGCRLNDDENLHPVQEAHKYTEGIPLPASFLVDKNGIVRYTSRPDRVGEFLDPAKIFPVLEKLG
ncbi:MAG: redoxin domain-containing protein [Bacteroidetes bacterium]|nr:redoxin domain-containing protein [Bacteroidota bacterium]